MVSGAGRLVEVALGESAVALPLASSAVKGQTVRRKAVVAGPLQAVWARGCVLVCLVV